MIDNELFCKDLMDELGRQLFTKQLYRQETLEIQPPPNSMEIVYIKDITEYIQIVIEGMALLNILKLIEGIQIVIHLFKVTGYTSIQGDKLELFWVLSMCSW